MQTINIIPLGNKVLVKPLPKQEKTTGGLIIPNNVQKDLEEAEVIIISTGVINIKAGNKVLYSTRTGISIFHEGVNYKFLNGPTEKDPGDIIAII